MKLKSIIGILCVLLPSYAMAAELIGRAIEVKSGDTVIIEDGNSQRHEIKLAGIDAPEHGQPYFHRSQKALADEVIGKTLRIHVVGSQPKSRIIGKALHDSEDINVRQLHLGMAWYDRHDLKHISSLDSTLFAQQERKARTKHLGLWRDRNPVAPWVYRETHAGESRKHADNIK